MFVEHVVGYWNIYSVPATPIAALISTEQEDRFSLSIEGEQHSYFGAARRAGSQFFHVRVTTRHDRVDQRPTQGPDDGAALLAIRPDRFDLAECLARPDHFETTVIDSANQTCVAARPWAPVIEPLAFPAGSECSLP